MDSRHIPDKDGVGHAADLVVLLPGRQISWAWPPYETLSEAMKQAAYRCGVPITWGGDWVSLKDGPHYELPRLQYPSA